MISVPTGFSSGDRKSNPVFSPRVAPGIAQLYFLHLVSTHSPLHGKREKTPTHTKAFIVPVDSVPVISL